VPCHSDLDENVCGHLLRVSSDLQETDEEYREEFDPEIERKELQSH